MQDSSLCQGVYQRRTRKNVRRLDLAQSCLLVLRVAYARSAEILVLHSSTPIASLRVLWKVGAEECTGLPMMRGYQGVDRSRAIAQLLRCPGC